MIFPPHQILWGRLIKEDVMSGERRASAYVQGLGWEISTNRPLGRRKRGE